VVTDALRVPLVDLVEPRSLRVGMYRLETGDSLGEIRIDLP
jgi:hypothetical protein